MADAVSTMIENLRVKTGKSLADWVGLAKGSGADKDGAMVGWLKRREGLTLPLIRL